MCIDTLKQAFTLKWVLAMVYMSTGRRASFVPTWCAI